MEKGRRKWVNFDFTKREWDMIFAKAIFTDQEKDIISLRQRGWTLSSIAAELYLSERTVNRRLNNITRKILKVI